MEQPSNNRLSTASRAGGSLLISSTSNPGGGGGDSRQSMSQSQMSADSTQPQGLILNTQAEREMTEGGGSTMGVSQTRESAYPVGQLQSQVKLMQSVQEDEEEDEEQSERSSQQDESRISDRSSDFDEDELQDNVEGADQFDLGHDLTKKGARKKKDTHYTVQQLKSVYTRPVLKLKKTGGDISLKDFTFLNMLGQGGFGQVYLVKSINKDFFNHQQMALKKIMICLNGHYMTEQRRMRVMRETQILETLQHPNIITLHKHFIDCETTTIYEDPPPQPVAKQSSPKLQKQITNLNMSLAQGRVSAVPLQVPIQVLPPQAQPTLQHQGTIAQVQGTMLQHQATIGGGGQNLAPQANPINHQGTMMMSQAQGARLSTQKTKAFDVKNKLSNHKQPKIKEVIEKWFLCIVMEHATKGDLLQLIDKHKNAKKPLEESTIWTLCSQVAYGLQYLHSQHVIHRDIKPQNILITSHNNFKIGDLGISRKLTNKAQLLMESKIGTPLYACPELIRKQPYDYKVDMWALGCVLHYMACLEHPFMRQVEVKGHHVNRQSIEYQILNQTPITLPELYSNRLRIVVQRLLEKDATRRLSAGELITLLPGEDPIADTILPVKAPSTQTLGQKFPEFLSSQGSLTHLLDRPTKTSMEAEFKRPARPLLKDPNPPFNVSETTVGLPDNNSALITPSTAGNGTRIGTSKEGQKRGIPASNIAQLNLLNQPFSSDNLDNNFHAQNFEMRHLEESSSLGSIEDLPVIIESNNNKKGGRTLVSGGSIKDFREKETAAAAAQERKTASRKKKRVKPNVREIHREQQKQKEERQEEQEIVIIDHRGYQDKEEHIKVQTAADNSNQNSGYPHENKYKEGSSLSTYAKLSKQGYPLMGTATIENKKHIDSSSVVVKQILERRAGATTGLPKGVTVDHTKKHLVSVSALMQKQPETSMQTIDTQFNVKLDVKQQGTPCHQRGQSDCAVKLQNNIASVTAVRGAGNVTPLPENQEFTTVYAKHFAIKKQPIAQNASSTLPRPPKMSSHFFPPMLHSEQSRSNQKSQQYSLPEYKPSSNTLMPGEFHSSYFDYKYHQKEQVQRLGLGVSKLLSNASPTHKEYMENGKAPLFNLREKLIAQTVQQKQAHASPTPQLNITVSQQKLTPIPHPHSSQISSAQPGQSMKSSVATSSLLNKQKTQGFMSHGTPQRFHQSRQTKLSPVDSREGHDEDSPNVIIMHHGFDSSTPPSNMNSNAKQQQQFECSPTIPVKPFVVVKDVFNPNDEDIPNAELKGGAHRVLQRFHHTQEQFHSPLKPSIRNLNGSATSMFQLQPLQQQESMTRVKKENSATPIPEKNSHASESLVKQAIPHDPFSNTIQYFMMGSRLGKQKTAGLESANTSTLNSVNDRRSTTDDAKKVVAFSQGISGVKTSSSVFDTYYAQTAENFNQRIIGKGGTQSGLASHQKQGNEERSLSSKKDSPKRVSTEHSPDIIKLKAAAEQFSFNTISPAPQTGGDSFPKQLRPKGGLIQSFAPRNPFSQQQVAISNSQKKSARFTVKDLQ